MALLRRRERPLTSDSRRNGRGCAGLFLIVWGLGFGGGGIAATGAGGGGAPPWIGIPLTLIGLAAIGLGIRLLTQRRVPVTGRVATAQQATLGIPAGVGEGGPRTVQPESSRGCAVTFLVPLTIAVFGATWAFWERSVDEGGARVAAIALSCVSLLLLLASVHVILASTNPRPEVDLPLGEIAIGTEVELPWRLVGSTSRLSTLTIQLIGREEARYRRGTNHYTDRNEFGAMTLVELGIDRLESSGMLRFRMPDCAVPSFAGQSNKVIWMLRFRAPIGWWPDVKDDVVLPVGPMRVPASGDLT